MITDMMCCPECQRDDLSRADFYAAKNTVSGLQRKCKRCVCEASTAWRKAHPERAAANVRRHNLQRKYGLTVEQYEELLAAQGGKCAGCGLLCRTRERLSVDHDHFSGAVRGLLCLACNHALGLVLDDPQTLRTLARYLEDSK